MGEYSMKAMINIGNEEGGKDSIQTVAQAVCQILEAGHEFRHEQATILKALEAFRQATSINGVSISGSSFYSTQKEDDDDE